MFKKCSLKSSAALLFKYIKMLISDFNPCLPNQSPWGSITQEAILLSCDKNIIHRHRYRYHRLVI